MLAKGTGFISLFDRGGGDSFFADETTDCGRWISEAGYKPKAWQYIPRSGAVLFNQSTEVRQSLEKGVLTESIKASSEGFAQELVRTTDN